MTQQINHDAEFCGRVPLNQTNLIQPHGVLLVVNAADNSILQASENAEEIFGFSARDMISKKLTDFPFSSAYENLLRQLNENPSDNILARLQFESGPHITKLHRKGAFVILEIEKQKNGVQEPSSISPYEHVKTFMAAVEAAATTEETCALAATELKKVSGFDKVMIYRFDEAWNGDVIAEAKEPGMDSYLGLKFPASDIPKQARELYKKTPYRLIPNVDYEPVKLYPVLNPRTNAFTDLSDSSLRSVAGVHLEYLRNMNVVASMSTRILKDGELWGLIACHHRTPNYLSYEMRSVFELLSLVISTKIGAVQTKDLLAYELSRQEQLVNLVQKTYRQEDPKQLLQTLLEADGIAVVENNKIETGGLTPTANEINDLVIWLGSPEEKKLLHQSNLSAVYEPAEAYAEKASGLLALPLEGGEGRFILAFRREAVRNVDWGGNPSEAVQFESDRKKYHPRASFKQWQQTVRHTAFPWSKELLRTAEEVQNLFSTYRQKSGV
ncbi:GAF domain-containing protein [Flavisolibacter ginsenosidimutans]|uniref:GAF domain-containing protein n=1 Tax=Flavisolibacter ginsenosidimutans TaxID=661481 RepID=A0A5B8UGU9_9BACT|nr:GAF domain-containing protein [Flavisolibacter ginsenosidimutans]QEC55748.1 GAF domain-containing protein [Flavisolibacter ginsenosidimutans]